MAALIRSREWFPAVVEVDERQHALLVLENRWRHAVIVRINSHVIPLLLGWHGRPAIEPPVRVFKMIFRRRGSRRRRPSAPAPRRASPSSHSLCLRRRRRRLQCSHHSPVLGRRRNLLLKLRVQHAEHLVAIILDAESEISDPPTLSGGFMLLGKGEKPVAFA